MLPGGGPLCHQALTGVPTSLTRCFIFYTMQKKKSLDSESSSEGSAPRPDAAARRAANQRFSDAVASLASNSDDDLWVRLAGAMVTDDKVDALCAALEKNTHVLSLDLSDNELTDVGVEKLCNTLRSGAAPDLIELLLRDNTAIGAIGTDALKALSGSRKSLRVESGASAPPAPPPGAASGGKDASLSGSLRDSAIVRKYFQVGNDEDEGESRGELAGSEQSAGDENGGLDAEQLSVLLWDQVRQMCIRNLYRTFLRHSGILYLSIFDLESTALSCICCGFVLSVFLSAFFLGVCA